MKIKLTFWKVIFCLIMAMGLYSTYVRYFHGLGAVSNLSDKFPWGIWIGFDCLCGVMLAAGAFVVTGVVYLLDIKRLHAIARPAVLTASMLIASGRRRGSRERVRSRSGQKKSMPNNSAGSINVPTTS